MTFKILQIALRNGILVAVSTAHSEHSLLGVILYGLPMEEVVS